MNVLVNSEDGNPVFFCPGCKCGHKVWVKSKNEVKGATWDWNGSLDKPTFSPSIKVERHLWVPPVTPENFAEYRRNPWPQTKKVEICHSFVTNGIISFCSDSTHELAGKSIPLQPFL